MTGDLNARFGELNQVSEDTLIFENEQLMEKRLTNDLLANRRGILMNESFEFYGYTLLNGRTKNDHPAKPTFTGHQGGSVIDVAWVNEIVLTEITNFEILHTYCVSDHFPCLIKMNVPGKKFTKPIITFYKTNKLKWENLGMKKTHTFTLNITLKKNPWFNSECRSLKKNLKKAAKALKKKQP
jgi:hypothetical protein